MAEKPTKSQSQQDAPTTASVSKSHPKKSNKKSCATSFASLFALLAIVIAVASISYSYWQSQQFTRQLAEQHSRQQSDLSDTIDNYAKQLGGFVTQNAMNESLGKLQNTVESLQTAVNDARLKAQQDNSAWVLAEVDYLVKLANYNLRYDANVEVARNILQAADQRAQALTSNDVSTLRAALARDLAKLDAIEKIDREGIVLRLSALSDMVAKLPVTDQVVTINHQAQATHGATDTSDWHDALQNSLSVLKNAVVIRHVDEPLKPLMSEQQHRNVIENIQLQLSMASWAVLHRDQSVFEHALQQAQKWIKDYLKPSELASAITKGIDELHNKNIAPVMPTLETSTNAIKHSYHSQAKRITVHESTSKQRVEQFLNKDTSLEVLSS